MLKIVGLIFKLLAWACIAAGVGLLFYAILPVVREGLPFQPHPLGQIWSELHSSSQLGVAHTLERWLGESYHSIIVPYFWNVPAFVILLILGLILWLLTARRRDRKNLEPKDRKW